MTDNTDIFKRIDYTGLPSEFKPGMADLNSSFASFHRSWPDLTFYGNIPAKYSENAVSWIEWMHWLEGWINKNSEKLGDLNQDFNDFVNHYNDFVKELPLYIRQLVAEFFAGTSQQGHVVNQNDYALKPVALLSNPKLPDNTYVRYFQSGRKIAGFKSGQYLSQISQVRLVMAKADNGWYSILINDDDTGQLSGSMKVNSTPGQGGLNNISTSGNPNQVDAPIVGFANVPDSTVPKSVRRVFPTPMIDQANYPSGTVVYMDETRHIWLAKLPAGEPLSVPVEHTPLFLLRAGTIMEGENDAVNRALSLTYIADDYSVWCHYQLENNGGPQEVKLIDKLPDNVINSIKGLEPEKVMGNAHQLVALVTGRTGDNNTDVERVITWSFVDTAIDNSNRIHPAFTPFYLFDSQLMANKIAATPFGLEQDLFFNMAPDDGENGVFSNLGLIKSYTTGKRETSTPIDTLQNVQPRASSIGSNPQTEAQKQAIKDAIDAQANDLITTIQKNQHLTDEQRTQQIQKVRVAAQNDKDEIDDKKMGVVVKTELPDMQRGSFGFLITYIETVTSSVFKNHDILTMGYYHANIDSDSSAENIKRNIQALYDSLWREVVNRQNGDSNISNVVNNNNSNIYNSMSTAASQMNSVTSKLDSTINKVDQKGDLIDKIINNLINSGAWDPATNTFRIGRNLATGNINWYAEQFGGNLFIKTHRGIVRGDGAFAAGDLPSNMNPDDGGTDTGGSTTPNPPTSQPSSLTIADYESKVDSVTAYYISQVGSISNQAIYVDFRDSMEVSPKYYPSHSLNNSTFYSRNFSIVANNWVNTIKSFDSTYSASYPQSTLSSITARISSSRSTSNSQSQSANSAVNSTQVSQSVSVAYSTITSGSAREESQANDTGWMSIYASRTQHEYDVSTAYSTSSAATH